MRAGPLSLGRPVVLQPKLPSALWLVVVILGLSMGACASPGAESLPARGVMTGQAVALLDDPALAGTRWGLLATTLEGEAVAEVRPDDRFIPASNTKIFTTAAAFARLDGLGTPDPADGTSVRLEPRFGSDLADLVLIGSGDPALGDGPSCVQTCLAELADAVAARLAQSPSVIGDVIGDDRLYPEERWGPGWSWEDMQEPYGAAVSALTVNDNVVLLEVAPGAVQGEPVRVTWQDGDDALAFGNVLTLENTALTVADGETDLRIERRPGEALVRLYGVTAVGAVPTTIRIGLDDPAMAAAARFRRLLVQRGVVVQGEVRARHRPLTFADNGQPRAGAWAVDADPEGVEIARLPRPPLLETLTRISKVSQNLHAELMLRRLGALEGSGSRVSGLEQVEAVLAQAGVSRAAFDLQDGSGMSAYNRISPRATTTFLLWTTRQPWGEAWRETLPVGGRDGTLARRFVGTPLEGRIFAKTGSLNGVNALAGFLTAASGQTLVFSIYANDKPSTAGSAVEVMDRALVALAAAN